MKVKFKRFGKECVRGSLSWGGGEREGTGRVDVEGVEERTRGGFG